MGVFLLKLAKAAKFADAQTAELLFPVEEGRLRDSHLPTDLLDTNACLGLTQGKSNLLLGEFCPFHGNDSLFSLRYSLPKNSTLEWSSFMGRGHFFQVSHFENEKI
jgi:hypothetical protein